MSSEEIVINHLKILQELRQKAKGRPSDEMAVKMASIHHRLQELEASRPGLIDQAHKDIAQARILRSQKGRTKAFEITKKLIPHGRQQNNGIYIPPDQMQRINEAGWGVGPETLKVLEEYKFLKVLKGGAVLVQPAQEKNRSYRNQAINRT